MELSDFRRRVIQAFDELKALKLKEIILVFHDDADGLCSAAICKKALEREGFQVKPFCLEKVYTEVIESLHSKSGQAMFYVDIGSSHADLISEYNEGRNLTIILDHHDPKPSRDSKVIDLNLEHYGFRGETDFSGSSCCYLFARTLSDKNVDLSYLALVGSCEIPNGFIGLNKTILEEASENKFIQQKGKGLEITHFKCRVDALFSKLQILGAVGYYVGGPEIGIKVCLEGLSEEAEKKINNLEALRKEANRRLLGRLYKERFMETEHIQWFDARDTYAGMGTKVIGQFCSFLAYQTRLVKPNKYILGFVSVPPNIPNWGELKQKFIKASVRVPKTLQRLIDDHKLLGAVNLLDKASEGFGLADGHQYAASIILPADKKHALIENAEKSISSFCMRT